MNRKIAIILALIVVISLVAGLTGCGKVETPSSGQEAKETTKRAETKKTEKKEVSKLQGKVSVEGSTSVTPIAEMLAEAFMEVNPDVTIEVTGNGSSAGVKAAAAGTADIGMASRYLKDSEPKDIIPHQIAWDAVAVSVHPSNTIENLTKSQVTAIFKGEIKNWSQVGGENNEIIVVSREAGSGTRDAFESIIKIKDQVISDALIADGNGAVRSNVSEKEKAIGYISLSYINDSVKTLTVNGASAKSENILNGAYEVKRPFFFLTKEDLSESAKAFLAFAFSEEGQTIVAKKVVPMQSTMEAPTYKGSIAIQGSTSVAPLMEMLSEAYMEMNKGLNIEVTGNGSSAGVKAVGNNLSDFGMASRNIKDKEFAEYQGLYNVVIAWDAIAIAVHPNNPVNALTKEQVNKIYTGEIKNWSEIGGSDSEIIVISREAGSGTRDAFEDMLDLEDKVMPDALIADGNGAVRSNVQEKENAIGYISFGYITDKVKPVAIDGTVADISNVLNGSYTVKRPFNVAVRGELSEEAQSLIDFILSTAGQEIVAKKYIPVK